MGGRVLAFLWVLALGTWGFGHSPSQEPQEQAHLQTRGGCRARGGDWECDRTDFKVLKHTQGQGPKNYLEICVSNSEELEGGLMDMHVRNKESQESGWDFPGKYCDQEEGRIKKLNPRTTQNWHREEAKVGCRAWNFPNVEKIWT